MTTPQIPFGVGQTLAQLRAQGFTDGSRFYGRALLPRELAESEELRKLAKCQIGKAVDFYCDVTDDNLTVTRLKWVPAIDNNGNPTLKADGTPAYKLAPGSVHPDGYKLLRYWNLWGGVYFYPNQGGRFNQDITACQSAFYECDDGSFDQQLAKIAEFGEQTGVLPTTVVKTRKSLHVYFRFPEPEWGVDGWSDTIQKPLALAMRSDPAVSNTARLMRLAGFNHVKWTNNTLDYVPVSLEVCEPSRQYFKQELKDAIASFLPQSYSKQRFKFWVYLNSPAHKDLGIELDAELARNCPEAELAETERRWRQFIKLTRDKANGKDVDPDEAFTCDQKKLPRVHQRKSYERETLEGNRDTINWARYLYGYNPVGRGDWITAQDPCISESEQHLHSIDSLHIHKATGALISHRGSDPKDVLARMREIAQEGAYKELSQLTYAPSLSLNQRYLGDIASSIPQDARLICLRSPKGSGKTESLKALVAQAHFSERPVILLSHRVQLCQALCDRLGLQSVYELFKARSEGKEAEAEAEVFARGFGLCMDSLHPSSQAGFTAEGWEDADIIIDESTQVFWHTLNSGTCTSDRVAILRELKTLLTNALSPETKGRVILADADLSDVAVDFVKNIAHQSDLPPWVVLNSWKPEQSWKVHNYQATKEEWLLSLENHIANGGRPFICLDSQKLKGKFSTSNMEASLAKKFPAKKILRIDSQTLQLQNHPAFGCMSSLDVLLATYDIVICSPSLETGVSIDIKGHFTSVWGLYQGCLPANSVRQSLARLREPVARHVWGASYGFGGIGNGETSVEALLESQNKLVRSNLHLIFDASIDQGEVNTNFVNGATKTWAKMAVQINSGFLKYRQRIMRDLTDEGHHVVAGNHDFGLDPTLDIDKALKAEEKILKTVKQEVIANRDTNQQEYGERVATISSLTPEEAEELESARSLKSETEQIQLQKHRLERTYGVEITSKLYIQDQAGWGTQLRLHYYLTQGRQHLKARDRAKRDSLVNSGQGWTPDLNKNLLSAQIHALEKLGFVELLEAKKDGEWRNDDVDLIAFRDSALLSRKDIKNVLGFTLHPGSDDPDDKPDTPVQVVTKFLKRLGLSLGCVRKEGSQNGQVRIYQLMGLDDGRAEIFSKWLERDEAKAIKQQTYQPGYQDESFFAPNSKNVSSSDTIVTAGNKNINTLRDYNSVTTVSSSDTIVTPGNKDINTSRDYQHSVTTGEKSDTHPVKTWSVGQRVNVWFGMGRRWLAGRIESVEINASKCFKAVIKLPNGQSQYVWSELELEAI